MFSPNQRKRPGGWLAPIYRFTEGISQWWRRLRHRTRELFDFRRVTMRISNGVQYLWWAVRYPFYVLGSLLRYLWSVLVAWWQIRNFRYLVQGLPALVAIIFIIIVTAYTFLRSDDGLQELYNRQFNTAKMHADRQRERLCLERLMQLQYVGDPRRLDTQYELGKLAGEMNQPQRSRSLLAELANPDSDEGYYKAHLERAKFIWANTRRQNDDLTLIEKHLRRALKKQSDDPDVNAFMGLVMAQRGRTDEAIPFLMKSHPTDVDARLALAKIYKMQGNQNQANLYLEPLINFLKTHASGEIDDVRYRVTLANAHMQMDEFEDAIKVLEAGYALKKNDFFKVHLSNCYMNWFIKLNSLPLKAERERLKLDCLVRALEWDNTNVTAMNLFVLYMTNTGNDRGERDNAHRLLMTLRGNNAYLHLWLGEKLNNDGKVEEARREWDLAYKLNPDCSIIANNFAWILTQGSETPLKLSPDLLKAERIINEVIARTPPEDKNRPYFFGTRGTIYMKMGKYEEARQDLVIATQRAGWENDFNLHRQLIEVYDRLRMPTMAENHRKLLAEIAKRNNRTEPGAQ